MIVDVLLRVVLALVMASGYAPAPASAVTYQGVAGWAEPSHGSRYLAMREKRGTRVRLCSTNGCWTATVNDYGPKKSTGSIADIAVVQWERMTGLPRSRGLGQFTVTILSRPHGAGPTLPPTDTGG